MIGERLRHERERRGMSLGALARLAGLGKGHLSQLERGLQSPGLATVEKLATALDVAPAYLAGWADPDGHGDASTLDAFERGQCAGVAIARAELERMQRGMEAHA